MANEKALHGGIDAGGTTFKCGVTDAGGELLKTRRIPVSTPEETLQGCADFFNEVKKIGSLASFGIASFGPIDVDRASPEYGTILKTPKPGWSGTNLKSYFTEKLTLDLIVDTDVNGALLAEMSRGAARGAKSAAYITVGTGIGAGLFTNDDFAGKPAHPEFGHIPLRRHAEDLAFDGVCPFHGDCLEGLASASAIRARWGEPSELPEDHLGWPIVADYLAQACRTLTLTLRLERIIIGGGLMLAPHLLGRVQASYDAQMSGYLGDKAPPASQLIKTPGLGDDAGLVGAVLLGSPLRD